MPKVNAGNPLWVEWLDKQALNLEEVGNKSSFVYKKASKNLSRNPIPFSHPSEAVSIEGIGPSVVKFLEKKLADYCKATGEDVPDRVSPVKKGRAISSKKRNRKEQAEEEEAERDAEKAARRLRTMGIVAPKGTYYQAPPGEGPPDSDEEGITVQAKKTIGGKKAPAKAKATTVKKSYVPKLRSGPFAILLALYQCATASDPTRWTLKAEIVEYAEGLCDVPFDTPSGANGGSTEGGANYAYSGWSSKKTLLDKKLVVELNKRPKKWALTEEGYALAHTLAPSADIPKHTGSFSSSNLLSDGSPRKVTNTWGEGNILGGGNRSSSNGNAIAGSSKLIKKVLPAIKKRKNDIEEEEDDADAKFEKELERAMELSRRESSEAKSIPIRSKSSNSELNVGSSSSNNAKKAAQGFYAGQGPLESLPKVSSHHDTPFGYYYLDEDDHRVLGRDAAEVMLEEGTHKQAYKIEFRINQSNHPITRNVIRQAALGRKIPEPGALTKSGYLKGKIANDNCPGFIKEVTTNVQQNSTDALLSLMGSYKPPTKFDPSAMYAAPSSIIRSGNDNHPSSSGSDVLPRFNSLKESVAKVGESSTTAIKRTQSAPSGSTSLNGSSNSGVAATAAKLYPIGKITTTSFESTSDLIVNRHPLDPIRDYISPIEYNFPKLQEIIWKAGTFKVILIIDTREIGTTKANRNEIIDKLKEKGIQVDRKMLPLGDMIWVARKIDSKGNFTGEDDIVLDSIVERKRLDDLCSSIIDGRYIGQKIRIKDSGITNRIYLIEKYDTASQYAEYGKQIWTAKSQLQVNDGFFVFESANINNTINYLAQRTQVMSEIYEKVNLSLIPDSLVDRQSYQAYQQHLRLTRPSTSFLTSYKSFENLNKSDAAISLSVQWATMIQSVSGMSAEKAVQFLNRWSTPKLFYDECRKRKLEVEEEDFLLDSRQGENGGGSSKNATSKRRKAEDFVVEELGTEELRGIRGKLGSNLFELFTAEVYSDKN